MNKQPTPLSSFSVWLFCVAAVLVQTGCHSLNVSEPKRTVTEQLLLSTATDRALQEVDLAPLRGKKVFLATWASW
jgi:hypothetical protein